MSKFRKITFKNEYRKVLMEYLKAKEVKKQAEETEKRAKAEAMKIFAEIGKEMKTTEKTEYLYGSVQVQGTEEFVLYKETTKRGTIDWQAYAMALGGTAEEAEAYRKASVTTTAIDWATDKQTTEIRGLQ